MAEKYSLGVEDALSHFIRPAGSWNRTNLICILLNMYQLSQWVDVGSKMLIFVFLCLLFPVIYCDYTASGR